MGNHQDRQKVLNSTTKIKKQLKQLTKQAQQQINKKSKRSIIPPSFSQIINQPCYNRDKTKKYESETKSTFSSIINKEQIQTETKNMKKGQKIILQQLRPKMLESSFDGFHYKNKQLKKSIIQSIRQIQQLATFRTIDSAKENQRYSSNLIKNSQTKPTQNRFQSAIHQLQQLIQQNASQQMFQGIKQLDSLQSISQLGRFIQQSIKIQLDNFKIKQQIKKQPIFMQQSCASQNQRLMCNI